MAGATLRKAGVLPLFNPYTLVAILVLGYLAMSVYIRILWGARTGIEYLYLLILLQAVPVFIAFTRRHFTYIAFIMVFHFFQLSLPKWFLFQENPLLVQTFPEVLTAIQEQTFCTLILILVYYACRNFLFSAVAEKERFQLLTLTRAQVVALSCYVLFVPLLLHRLPAWFLSIHFLLLSADLILLFSAQSPGNRGIIVFTQIAAVIGAFNYFLVSGMMTLMGALVSLVVLVLCLKKRFSGLFLVVAAVILLSAIQTVKGAYRMVIREPSIQLTTSERIGVLWELLSAKYIEGEETEVDEDDEEESDKKEDIGSNLISGFMRAGDDSLERVLAATPNKVPFWGGETYTIIPYMFIPRAFWADKPSRHFWNKYGRLYGVLSPNDYQTSVGVSFLAEAYMNFGLHGMYLVSVIVGFLIAFVERSSFYILGGYFYFPYIVLLTPLLAPGSDLGSILNSLWVIYIVFLIGRPLLLGMAQRDEYSA